MTTGRNGTQPGRPVHESDTGRTGPRPMQFTAGARLRVVAAIAAAAQPRTGLHCEADPQTRRREARVGIPVAGRGLDVDFFFLIIWMWTSSHVNVMPGGGWMWTSLHVNVIAFCPNKKERSEPEHCSIAFHWMRRGINCDLLAAASRFPFGLSSWNFQRAVLV